MAERVKPQLKARYWTGVLYPENMIDDWQTEIGDILQLPYAYCIHDKDHLAEYKAGKTAKKDVQERDRKKHVHIIIAFPNTTTYNFALETLKKLSKDGARCINKCESVTNIRNVYEYLLHNTETAKKQKKYLYPVNERITGNNFDIGAYEQLGVKEKQDMKIELGDVIIEHNFTNYSDFYMFVRSNMDAEYMEILTTHSGHFEKLTRGNYQRFEMEREIQKRVEDRCHDIIQECNSLRNALMKYKKADN